MTTFTPGATTFTPGAVVRPKATGALGEITGATAECDCNALLARFRMIRPGSIWAPTPPAPTCPAATAG